ncbi:MAG: Serine/threonine-protein kinase [Chrysothrix sp. TS-e1954]|nr:MAG: Serine/threonine-protein kinase [Chrysothrix sp. TS-e1954]
MARRSNTPGETLIGPYKRLESIGKGSFAVVYKAIHPDDNSLIAIKTVQHAALKGKLKANLFSEIDIMRTVTHPHIVALINILESSNHIHLIMEFCQLGDLATFVRKRDKLAAHPVTADMLKRYPNSPDAGFNEVIVRHFAKQLASALEFLRSKNFVHRDLKPQNLLLNPPPAWLANESPENRPFQVSKESLKPAAGLESLPFLKIADFGFARHLPTTTLAETLCGSPLYMAPEILRYEKYDAKADLWSVGTVLYELMVGRPPFKAANHVELLRRIERAMDKIKFPDDLRISEDMKKVIRSLLKKMPTERLSWEYFFQSSIILDDIPGLVGSDRRTEKTDSAGGSPHLGAVAEALETPVSEDNTSGRGSGSRRNTLDRGDGRPAIDRTASGPPPRSSPKARHAALASPAQQRPGLTSHLTSPAVQGVRNDRLPGAVAMERRRSQNTPPKTSVPEPHPPRDRVDQRAPDRAVRETRERAANDVAFERDYVMVEKRAVEVNAFADELAANPNIHSERGVPSSAPSAMVRRTGSQEAGSLTTRQNQVALRPDMHQRKKSYERSFGINRTTSATSALAAALNMVNFRFGGSQTPFSPGKGAMPQGYGPYPAFPPVQAGPLLLGDSPRATHMDEDQKALSTLEESATRSDVVYGFGEVKYKQLIPIAPSNENPLGIHKVDPRAAPGDGTIDDDGLTVDAIVAISEEALVLYVKALSILSNTISLAGSWVASKPRGEVLGEVSSLPRTLEGKTSSAAVGNRINNVVQWARNRFNECLEKSEFVSRKLLDAQKRLPSDHPGHPNNHRKALQKAQRSDMAGSEINLSSGITAEKLMYDRALEMSRSAAVTELVGEDLAGCEVSYLTSIRLLEAVLDQDEDSTERSGTTTSIEDREKRGKDGKTGTSEMEDADRETVIKRMCSSPA